ncbi:MAG: hypothetical protein ACTSVV_11685 [Promethearchaeota archaeon]
MATKLNKIYVGAIVNRDLEIFEKLRKFAKLNYNINIVNLINFKKNSFSEGYLKKKIKKYPFSLLIVKLYSEEENQKIYDLIDKYFSDIPRLNSVRSVKICESRRNTFKLIEEKCKKINIPKTYFSINSALKAIDNGTPIIIKLDTHNIRNLSKYDRIIGVAKTREQFLNLIRKYDVQNNVLFFQEYLGKSDIIYKVYVIDQYVQTITSQDLLRKKNFTPLELIHMRVSIDHDLKRHILMLGRKFNMSIFGVDYLLKDGIPYIVDVNDFPSFRNIPEAVSLISNYIHRFLEARINLPRIPKKLKAKTYMI